jgi:rod shape-determining protein MreD
VTGVPYRPFAPALAPGRARALPPATIVAGSLLTAWPGIAHAPVLPPFGLLMLLAWRLLAPASLRIWAPALLGFVDDLVSGQPLGSAVLLWTLAFLVLELVEQRLLFRAFGQEWAIAAIVIALSLIAGRYLASPWNAPLGAMTAAQIVAAILCFPLAAWLCAWLDRKRGGAPVR